MSTSSPDGAPRPPRVVDHLARTLEAAGIEMIFGVPGGAIAPLYDALLDRKIRILNFRHETGAVFAAMGAALQGKRVCVLVTSGPGITNAITGIAAAFLDGLPVLVIAGEVPARNAGRGALQDGTTHTLDVLAMVRPVTKLALALLHPGSAEATLRRALATSMSGRRGPVFLTLPSDVGSSRTKPAAFAPGPRLFFETNADLCVEAAAALSTAERPVILAGWGSRDPQVRAALVTIAERLQCPVISTPKGKGTFPEDHPLAAGVLGYGGHPSAVAQLDAGPDVVLVVGSSLGETSTSGWSAGLRPSRCLIQVDIDASVVGRNYQADLALIGPAEDIVPLLASHVAPSASRAPRTIERLEHAPIAVSLVADGAGDAPLHPMAAVRALQQRFGDATYTVDVGEHLMFAVHALRIGTGAEFFGMFALGSMGTGIGVAVGAKLARPDKVVVGICGDWGFQMCGQELATCVDAGAGVVFAVMNDGAMRMVEAGFGRIFGRSPRFSGAQLDFAALATSVGARGIRVSSAADIARVPLHVGRDGVPTVLDIRIDPRASFPQAARAELVGTFLRGDRPT